VFDLYEPNSLDNFQYRSSIPNLIETLIGVPKMKCVDWDLGDFPIMRSFHALCLKNRLETRIMILLKFQITRSLFYAGGGSLPFNLA
jgi:hypothetical protein